MSSLSGMLISSSTVQGLYVVHDMTAVGVNREPSAVLTTHLRIRTRLRRS